MENKHRIRKRAAERGNVLFLILVATALFAALSYVVVQSSRTGSGDAQREKASLIAAEIYNYATALQTAVGRMIISGCDLQKISFENPYDGGLHINGNASADRKCHVFEPPGGGVAPKQPRAGWASDPKFYYSGSAAITGLNQTCATSDCADMVLVLRGVSEAVCQRLNALNSYDVTLADLSIDTLKSCPYTGTMDCGGDGSVEVVFAAPELKGKHSVCYRDSVHGLTFLHAILER